jgi:hypothetical protein
LLNAQLRARPGLSAVTVVLLCLTACTSSASDDATGSEPTARNAGQDAPSAVVFDFENVVDGASVRVANAGSLKGAAKSEVANGGRVEVQPAFDGQALRFPAFDDSDEPARAVLVYSSSGGGLDPGEEDFRFGADFMLDEVTQGGNDDGNNLVQRGLSVDRMQYKLQAENGFASCRLEGDQGSVRVTSRVRVEPRQWYRVMCWREGDEVSLRLETPDGKELDTVTRGTRTGSLEFDSSVPLAMGGKLAPDGDVVRRMADQLNGALDNVFVTIG